MRKLWAYALMALVVLLTAAADGWVLTRAESRRLFVESRLRELMGDQLLWGDADITLTGGVALQEARLFTPKGLLALNAERLEIQVGLGGLERIRLSGFRGTLTEALISEAAGLKGTERPIRELFPNPDRMPQLHARQGALEIRLPAVFEGGQLQTVEVHDLRAVPLGDWRYAIRAEVSHAAYGAWEVRGEVDLDRGTQRFRIEGRNLVVGPGWRAPLVERFRDIFDTYQPSGRCDIAVDLERAGRETPLSHRTTLRATDMKMTYQPFPYAMEGVHGEIEFDAAGFHIQEMRGRHGDRTAKLDGDGWGYGSGDEMLLRFEADGILIDEALLNALPAQTRAVMKRYSPKGRVDVRGRALRPKGGHERIPLDLVLHGAEATYDAFPYAVKNLEGRVHAEGDTILIQELVSREGARTMRISGRVLHATGDADVELAIEAERLPLDERLRKAAGEPAARAWELFAPEGELDVRWVFRKEPGKEAAHSARAKCRGNRATYKDVPLPVTELQGEVEMEGGLFRLKHLSGAMQGGRVEIHGTATAETLKLNVDGKSVPIDDAFKAAMPADLSELLKELNLTGTAAFNATLDFRKESRQVDLKCRLSRAGFGRDLRFEEVSGDLTLTGYPGAEPLYQGVLSLDHATLAGKRLEGVTASFALKGSKLGFSRIRGLAYGGMLFGQAWSADLKTRDHEGQGFVLDGVELGEFMRDTQAFGDKQVGGKVRMEIPFFRGNTADAGTLTGKGNLKIREAELWDIPIFLKVATLNPGELFKEKKRFDAGALAFTIKDRRFDISELALRSESVSMIGKGRIGFDGSLNVELRPQSGALFGVDFFLLNWAGALKDVVLGGSVKVTITGTLEKPEVK
jgi:hypothetical protein